MHIHLASTQQDRPGEDTTPTRLLIYTSLLPFIPSHIHHTHPFPIHQPNPPYLHPTHPLLITLHTLTSPLLKSPIRKLSGLTFLCSLPCSHTLTFFLLPSHSTTTPT